jgi:hypothetical protein
MNLSYSQRAAGYRLQMESAHLIAGSFRRLGRVMSSVGDDGIAVASCHHCLASCGIACIFYRKFCRLHGQLYLTQESRPIRDHLRRSVDALDFAGPKGARWVRRSSTHPPLRIGLRTSRGSCAPSATSHYSASLASLPSERRS